MSRYTVTMTMASPRSNRVIARDDARAGATVLREHLAGIEGIATPHGPTVEGSHYTYAPGAHEFDVAFDCQAPDLDAARTLVSEVLNRLSVHDGVVLGWHITAPHGQWTSAGATVYQVDLAILPPQGPAPLSRQQGLDLGYAVVQRSQHLTRLQGIHGATVRLDRVHVQPVGALRLRLVCTADSATFAALGLLAQVRHVLADTPDLAKAQARIARVGA